MISSSVSTLPTRSAIFVSGVIVFAKNGKEAIALAEELLTNEEKRNAMIAAQQREINPHAAEDIVRSMQRWISNK